MRRFVRGQRFWEIALDGRFVITRHGVVGKQAREERRFCRDGAESWFEERVAKRLAEGSWVEDHAEPPIVLDLTPGVTGLVGALPFDRVTGPGPCDDAEQRVGTDPLRSREALQRTADGLPVAVGETLRRLVEAAPAIGVLDPDSAALLLSILPDRETADLVIGRSGLDGLVRVVIEGRWLARIGEVWQVGGRTRSEVPSWLLRARVLSRSVGDADLAAAVARARDAARDPLVDAWRLVDLAFLLPEAELGPQVLARYPDALPRGASHLAAALDPAGWQQLASRLVEPSGARPANVAPWLPTLVARYGPLALAVEAVCDDPELVRCIQHPDTARELLRGFGSGGSAALLTALVAMAPFTLAARAPVGRHVPAGAAVRAPAARLAVGGPARRGGRRRGGARASRRLGGAGPRRPARADRADGRGGRPGHGRAGRLGGTPLGRGPPGGVQRGRARSRVKVSHRRSAGYGGRQCTVDASSPGAPMWIVWLARVATAGCVAWSADDEARLAGSGIIVAGTVHDLVLDGTTVRQHVEITRAWKGHVRSGWLTLVTTASAGTCPGDGIRTVGTGVYVIGDPDENGEIPVGPCVPSVGWLDGAVPRLVGLAAKQASTARTVEGSPPLRPRGPIAAIPEPGAGRARIVRAGTLDLGGERHVGTGAAVTLEGAVLAEQGGQIRGIWETDALQVVGWVDSADVERVPVRTVSLAPGVVIAPGTSLVLAGDGATYDLDGVRVSGTVPADALGRVWTPEPLGGGTRNLSVTRDASWSAVPGGPGVGHLAADGTFALARAGRAVDGQVPVRIAAPGLRADGWLPADAVSDGAGGGGVAGGMYGMGSWPTIELPTGTALTALEAPVVFARTTGPLTVRRLAEGDGRVWVIVDTPWGGIGGEATVPVGP